MSTNSNLSSEDERLVTSMSQKISKSISNSKKINKTKKKTKSVSSSNSFSLPKKDIILHLLKQAKKIKCHDIFDSDSLDFEGEGVANKVFSGCIDDECSKKIAFRLMPVSKKYSPSSKTHPINVEIALYKKFNSLVKKNIFPHVPLLLKNLKCQYDKVIQEDDIVEDYKEQVNEGAISPEINIMILEYCPGGSIKSFVDKNKKKPDYIRSAFFQILLGLCVLQYHIKGFRHNDLHSSNVNVGSYNLDREEKYQKSIKAHKKMYIAYEIFGETYYIPYYGFCMKIIDFDVSCSKKIKNGKVDLDKVYVNNGVTCKKNPVFDSHLVMNSCFYPFFKSGFFGKSANTELHPEIESFITRNIPSTYIGFNNSKLGYARVKDSKSIPEELKTPIELITEDKFFDNYRVLPKDGKVIHTYITKIPKIQSLSLHRKDMSK